MESTSRQINHIFDAYEDDLLKKVVENEAEKIGIIIKNEKDCKKINWDNIKISFCNNYSRGQGLDIDSITPVKLRTRYINYLLKEFNFGDLTVEEFNVLNGCIKKLKELGKIPWSTISKYFPNRSPSILKNKYNKFLKHQNRKFPTRKIKTCPRNQALYSD